MERICELWLTLHCYRPQVSVEWVDVTVQDLVEEARAQLYRQQARTVEMDNEAREKGETV